MAVVFDEGGVGGSRKVNERSREEGQGNFAIRGRSAEWCVRGRGQGEKGQGDEVRKSYANC